MQCPHCCQSLEVWKPGFFASFGGRHSICSICGIGFSRRARRSRCARACGFHVCKQCTGILLHTSPTQKKSIALRTACEYGINCYQKCQNHLATYVHPGDPDYRQGRAIFSESRHPEFLSLWHMFLFFDVTDSGNLTFEEFVKLVGEVGRRSENVLDAKDEWKAASGEEEGYLTWVRFALWSHRVGLRLPVGVDDAPGGARLCRFGGPCTCQEFCGVLGNQQRVCACGHKESMHMSDRAYQSLATRLVSRVPRHWELRSEQLVRVTDMTLLATLQLLLDATHKDTDNWTRDRGCYLHGRNSCKPECLFKHRNRVPTGYMLVSAYRNQNRMWWARYTLARAAILQDCQTSECRMNAPQSSKTPFDQLDSAPLVSQVNEWRLLHGSSHSSCRSICEKNFDLSCVGVGGTWKKGKELKGEPLYGNGVYFAERITKADEYAVPCDTAHPDEFHEVCSVLLCRVIGGRSNVCTKNEIDSSSLRQQVFAGPHHSVLGDRVQELKKPYREFVVYDRDQIFPEYLLNYIRVYSTS